MEHKRLGLIIVPDISLCAMNQLSLREVVRSTLLANTQIQRLHLHMRQLYSAIIRRVYYFEEPGNQHSKLEEVRTSREKFCHGQLTDW